MTDTADAQILADMEAAGVSTTQPVQADYFAFERTDRFMMPDGVSYLELRAMNEGARRDYMNKVNSEVTLQRQTGNAQVKMQTGEERHTLFVKSIVGWNLMSGGKPVPFDRNLEKFLTALDPVIADKIDKKIRELNPWLISDLSLEDIDRQIEELQQTRVQRVKQLEGKDS